VKDSGEPVKKKISNKNAENARIIPIAGMNGRPVTGGLKKKRPAGIQYENRPCGPGQSKIAMPIVRFSVTQ
jgi:hypothetical protein